MELSVRTGAGQIVAEAGIVRRRRLHIVGGFVVLLGVALGLFFGLRGPNGTSSPSQSLNHGAQARTSLTHLSVPVGGWERQWRHWISGYASGSRAAGSRVLTLRHQLRSRVAKSGATVVRLKLWPNTAPPAVELVIATATSPAAYLKHELGPLLSGIPGEFRFVEVVNHHGSMIFQNMYRMKDGHPEGMVGAPPQLQSCSPILTIGFGGSPKPCPAS